MFVKMLNLRCIESNRIFSITTRLKSTTTSSTGKASYTIKHLNASPPSESDVGLDLSSNDELFSISTKMFNGMIDHVSKTDAEAIVKQLDGSFVSNIVAVEKERCMHGYPRAFVRFPVTTHGALKTVSGGFIRLTCPLLVEAVDKLEGQHLNQETEVKMDALFSDYKPKEEGSAIDRMKRRSDNVYNRKDGHGEGIGYFNRLVASSPELQSNFHDVNKAHSDIRKALVSLGNTGERDCTLTGTESKQISNKMAMQSGIAGITQGSIEDVKCLHVHLADFLVRGSSSDVNTRNSTYSSGNLVGGAVVRTLEHVMDINIKGCKECSKQCDPSVRGGEIYGGNKNKLGIRRRRKLSRDHANADRGFV